MQDEIIKIEHLTKDYGDNKGVFDINLSVAKGEVFGFLGPNGAGKTTTIRNIMGFIYPDSGKCCVCGMDSNKDVVKIQKKLGYLAGEISFLEDMTGKQMIDFIAEMKGISDKSRIDELSRRFEINTSVKIRKMSKGMKQKIGIICAFMGNPEIIILDEPTSGLDPLMQNEFIKLVLEEKSKGKTIFMSSHIFEEIEKTCDRVAIIKNGKIIDIEDMEKIKKHRTRTYAVEFVNESDVEVFLADNKNLCKNATVDGKEISVIFNGKASEILNVLANYEIDTIDVKKESLEEMFLHFYEEDGGEE